MLHGARAGPRRRRGANPAGGARGAAGPAAAHHAEAAEFRDACSRSPTCTCDRTIRPGDRPLEEARTRYPSDPRVSRARFQLAEAYRLSRRASRRPSTIEEPTATRSAHRRLSKPAAPRALSLRRGHRPARADARSVAAETARTTSTTPACAWPTSTGRLRVRRAGIRRRTGAGRLFRGDPSLQRGGVEISPRSDSLSAYVQMIHAYMRLGDMTHARATLERAQWILRGIPTIRRCGACRDARAPSGRLPGVARLDAELSRTTE